MPKSIPISEFWDEESSSFITIQNGVLIIEHSLLSLHEWERKWKKPFLSETERSIPELVDYVRCMTLNRDEVDERIYSHLSRDVLLQIKEYIEDPMTATKYHSIEQGGKRETVTAEIIYYAMIAYEIPFECASWHLNSLLSLIRVCSVKNGGSKKMSRAENGVYQRQLNEQRLKAKKHH